MAVETVRTARGDRSQGMPSSAWREGIRETGRCGGEILRFAVLAAGGHDEPHGEEAFDQEAAEIGAALAKPFRFDGEARLVVTKNGSTLTGSRATLARNRRQLRAAITARLPTRKRIWRGRRGALYHAQIRWTSPMSLLMRETMSPILLLAKKRGERFCKWR